ncbi:hypothetical protein HPB51_006172 [Rhipicephalus microplus]|uniref:Tc1-like transposase DDE domain-containing protein n=1 Tax=Rhipicephalus microplus TaxID=6941 RepID=A0A9J6E6M8_RHIMP|nr:hypothetical protein HPB51_006172 [Rhipicephalus microplus]
MACLLWCLDQPQGHTAISTSTFYSVLKERPKRFVHANLLDAIDPNESDFSADKKSDEKVSGDSSDEGDAIQTEVKEAEEEVATSTDAPSVDRTPRNMKRRYTWVKKDFDIEAGSFENNFPLPPAEPLSAVEYFDVFVSRSMLKAVVDESNKYYFQKHGTTLNLTVEKLTPVLGMFFRMGLVNMHRELGIQVSETTAKRHSAEAGLRMRVACHKPLLQKPNHAKWLQFARDHEPWTTSDWEKVVFTGDTSFTTRWNLRQEAWRPENSRYSPKYPLEVAASDRSAVFVWGLVTKEGLGPLVLIKDTYTSECYCSILDDVMVPYLSEGPFPEGDYILQQNNSPVHRSRKVTTFLENRGINILSWPPQSPDLNIIESVWDLMKTALQSRSLHGVSADDLWEAINEEWERLRSDRSLTADLYNSLPSIMAAVVTANEEATRLPRMVTRIGYPPSFDGNSSSALRGYARGGQPPPTFLGGAAEPRLQMAPPNTQSETQIRIVELTERVAEYAAQLTDSNWVE